MQVSCVSCGEFFEPTPEKDRLLFISENADKQYLQRIPFPKKFREQFKTREAFVAYLLLGYCPYCREVKFGRVAETNLPRGELSEDKYLHDFEREIRASGGFQIEKHRKDRIVLENDEN